VSGEKLTHAIITIDYQGDLEGEGTLEYLMYYPGDETAVFNGMEKIVGRLGGRSGSFVIQHNGTFGAEGVKGTFSVIPGSGSGDLRGLRGKGAANLVGHADRYPITLDYDLE
jgi:hypothetical protein